MSRSGLSAPRPRSRSGRLDRAWSILYAAPAVALVLAFLAYPLVRVFGYALTSWNGVGPAAWVGLRNFSGLVHDPVFLAALRNNVIYAISVPVEVIGALVIAHLLYERVPGWKVFRSAFFLPAVYSTVVIGIIAGVTLQANGPIDNSMRSVGLSVLARNWLGSAVDARIAIIAIVIWANFGYSVLIYLAGMSALDPQLAEAARLDGAGSWYILFRVHGPNLRGVMQLVLVINTVTAFAYMFAYIYTITNGGPGTSTESISTEIYDTAFVLFETGRASALGNISVFVVIVLTRLYFQAIQLRKEAA